MKGLTVLTLLILIAATALAYAHTDVSAVVSAASAPDWPGEPAMLLLSGSALLALGGAVRRYTF